ncbi:cysteine hydrolase family protein [Chitinophaga polysaccharea]|uniref:cysteine hydrolase family protein n=1 Tax=Chitinophaga polysaccharea TaxID=1293035 RepID=UPI001B3B1D05|nr:isochorismatase family cysteine hydrolase [Chitinophaga polysaccharea]
MTATPQQHTALLVMDFQRKMMERLADPTALLNNVARAIAGARKAGIPVIYVGLMFRPGYPEVNEKNIAMGYVKKTGLFIEGGEGTAIHPAVAPLPGETIVAKKRYSAFAGSDLDTVLKAQQVERLVLAGYSTSGVVLSTLREAGDKDYQLTVLSDGCGDTDAEVHQLLMTKVFVRQAEVTTIDEWLKTL